MNKILHNSVLYVNLEQLRRNVRTLLGELEGKELVPVLKGNAYGLGLERIGRELAAFEEIHTLAVAQVSEGAALREAGVEKDILVLGGVPERLLAPAAELDLTLPVWRLGGAAPAGPAGPGAGTAGEGPGEGGDRPAPGGG